MLNYVNGPTKSPYMLAETVSHRTEENKSLFLVQHFLCSSSPKMVWRYWYIEIRAVSHTPECLAPLAIIVIGHALQIISQPLLTILEHYRRSIATN